MYVELGMKKRIDWEVLNPRFIRWTWKTGGQNFSNFLYLPDNRNIIADRRYEFKIQYRNDRLEGLKSEVKLCRNLTRITAEEGIELVDISIQIPLHPNKATHQIKKVPKYFLSSARLDLLHPPFNVPTCTQRQKPPTKSNQSENPANRIKASVRTLPLKSNLAPTNNRSPISSPLSRLVFTMFCCLCPDPRHPLPSRMLSFRRFVFGSCESCDVAKFLGDRRKLIAF